MASSSHQRSASSSPSPSSSVDVSESESSGVNPGMAIVGQVAGGLLHDFNNILTVITGTIDILAEAVEDKPELAAVARLIDEAATRGARLTSQLLSFARGRPPRPCAVELNELLVDVGRLLRPTLGTDVEVTTSVAADVPSVYADPGQLMAALLCLAIGARHRLEHGGRIDIDARRISDGGAAVEDPRADVLIVLTASVNADGVSPSEPIFSEIKLVDDFVRRSNGRLALKEPHDRTACVEIVLPRIDREPS
ncbi:histidine kinase dimerization/phospho-acceptor domain-containing protein [Bradyrhizobium sp. HKCCYLS3077]|uniref:histidine kinase dimerization/phospho-acceptor domain-containing protein n=1 Tax=Bradyrhizobium sp. HKCCYLS3077 TaxID=3420761 RepID=UPI003EBFF8D9